MLGTTSAGWRKSSSVERLARAKVWRSAADVERCTDTSLASVAAPLTFALVVFSF